MTTPNMPYSPLTYRGRTVDGSIHGRQRCTAVIVDEHQFEGQSIYNSAATESNDSIKEKAAQVYYSQNRMITAEDYQVVPLSPHHKKS